MGNLWARGQEVPQEAEAPRPFAIGDRVVCNTDDGWKEGVVVDLNYREDDWPEDRPPAPYQVELTDGRLVFAPRHAPELIREAVGPSGEPWHVRLAREFKATGMEEKYPKVALHKHLFDPEVAAKGGWFVPELLEALASWRSSKDPKDIDLAKLPDVKLEAPGVVSFNCLTHEFCDELLAEAKHYQESGFPQKAPNSMNNYGLVLNEVGLRFTFDALLRGFILGLGARLFGDDGVRAESLNDAPLETEDWGGSTLTSHHTFIVRYRPDEDRHLDMHVDECDVTFNFGLMDSSGFEGSDLAICGMFGSPEHRKHIHTYKHVKGRCVVHSGKRRHGALNITAGERASLIMWTKSPAFRRTEAYAMRWGRRARIEKESGDPDLVCLSETHDRDYEKWNRQLQA